MRKSIRIEVSIILMVFGMDLDDTRVLFLTNLAYKLRVRRAAQLYSIEFALLPAKRVIVTRWQQDGAHFGVAKFRLQLSRERLVHLLDSRRNQLAEVSIERLAIRIARLAACCCRFVALAWRTMAAERVASLAVVAAPA